MVENTIDKEIKNKVKPKFNGKGKGKGRQIRCPYCGERDRDSLNKKGRIVDCYTCGNDFEL